MQYKHYEISPKDIKKALKKAEKYGRMIDPKDVAEGQEYLKHVLCAGCGKIPLKLNIKECENCSSIVCDSCFYAGQTANDDSFFQKMQDGIDEDLFDSIRGFIDCPACHQALSRRRRNKNHAKMAAQKLNFTQKCTQSLCGSKRQISQQDTSIDSLPEKR